VNAGSILVIGGTGLIGEPVARQLLRDGFEVRLLVRDAGRARAQLGAAFDYREGDIDAVDVIAGALHGCAGVHISLRADASDPDLEYRAVARIAALATQQKIGRISYVSGALVYPQYVQGRPDQAAKLRAEDVLRSARGVSYTIFKPNYFMETLPRHVQGKRAIVLGSQPHALAMVSATDFAQLVSRAFGTPLAANRDFYVSGPENITIAEALRLYCQCLAPGVRVTSVPLWFMSIIDKVFLRQKLRSTIELMKLMQRVGISGDAAATGQILGYPATTLREWCERQRVQRTCQHSETNVPNQ
jgi:NADH dehydrogenase